MYRVDKLYTLYKRFVHTVSAKVEFYAILVPPEMSATRHFHKQKHEIIMPLNQIPLLFG